MIHSLENNVPQLHPEARIAANATLVGRVSVGAAASVWYGAVLRGDECSIRLGDGSNVQDEAVVHGAPDFPTVFGRAGAAGYGGPPPLCTVGGGGLIGTRGIRIHRRAFRCRRLVGPRAR